MMKNICVNVCFHFSLFKKLICRASYNSLSYNCVQNAFSHPVACLLLLFAVSFEEATLFISVSSDWSIFSVMTPALSMSCFVRLLLRWSLNDALHLFSKVIAVLPLFKEPPWTFSWTHTIYQMNCLFPTVSRAIFAVNQGSIDVWAGFWSLYSIHCSLCIPCEHHSLWLL